MDKETKKARKELEKVSHDFIRWRDSLSKEFLCGNCFDCGKYCEGQSFQCGHFYPSGSSGAILRYHPENMHGQFSGCNMKYQQEKVKINYTMAMIKKYGKKKVERLGQLKNKSIKADILFYKKMIELYKLGDERAIIKYLKSL